MMNPFVIMLPIQQDPFEAAHLVTFLLANEVQAEQSNRALEANGKAYPAGTYLVCPDQPKLSLANTILWVGWDTSTLPADSNQANELANQENLKVYALK